MALTLLSLSLVGNSVKVTCKITHCKVGEEPTTTDRG